MRLLVLVPSLLQILSSTRRVKAYPAYDKSPLSPRSSTSSSSQKFPLVTGLQKVPDDDHPYLDPLPTNDRGPCPGLNALANHGYIPLNGIATLSQLVDGLTDGFNLGDVSIVLSQIAITLTGNPQIET